MFTSPVDTPYAPIHRTLFESAFCGACPERQACSVRGTTWQCSDQPTRPGNMVPGGILGGRSEGLLGREDRRLRGTFGAMALPPILHRVEPQFAASGALDSTEWVSFPLTSNTVRNGGREVCTKHELLHSCGLPPAHRALLVLTGRDLHLAQVAHHAHDFVSSVAAAGFDLVLGFAPSLWDTDGPFHNRQQSFIADKVTLLLADAGVDVVPALAAYTARELRDFARATNDGKTTPLVWLDFQTAGKRAWPRVMAEPRWRAAAPPLPLATHVSRPSGSRARRAGWSCRRV